MGTTYGWATWKRGIEMRLQNQIFKAVQNLDIPNFRGISIDLNMYHDSGESIVTWVWSKEMSLLGKAGVQKAESKTYKQIIEETMIGLKENIAKKG